MLVSRTQPGGSSSPTPASSSPVASTATRGRRDALIAAAPAPARGAFASGVTSVPAGSSTSPARQSSPGCRTSWPGGTVTVSVIRPSSAGSVSS